MKNNTKNNIPNKTACLCGEQTAFRGDICKGGSSEKYVWVYERLLTHANTAFGSLKKHLRTPFTPLPANLFKTFVLSSKQLNKIIDKIKLARCYFYLCNMFVSHSSMPCLQQ